MSFRLVLAATTAISALAAPLAVRAADAPASAAPDPAQVASSPNPYQKLDFSIVVDLSWKHVARYPVSGVTQGPDGAFYGAWWTVYRSNSPGTVSRVTPEGDLSSLHKFKGNRKDPGYPTGEPVFASDGNLYGLAAGSVEGAGSLYRITPEGEYTVLHLFYNATEGGNFAGSPVVGPDGRLYFVAQAGSTGDAGAVLAATLDGDVQVVHAFTGGADGAYPVMGLTLGDDGNFYGMTAHAGDSSPGTFYRISTGGELVTLATLDTTVCDMNTTSWRLAFSQGYFYGTCPAGGVHQGGSLIRVSEQGVVESLHDFGKGQDGANPEGGLVVDPATNEILGTTSMGGAYGVGIGTLFKFSLATGSYKKLLDFGARRWTSAHPEGDLFLATDGYVYGTTLYGGKRHGGAVYRFHP